MALITVMKSKISYAEITHANLYYEGSITIDEDLMDKANIRANEQVQLVNVNNGERMITYAIPGERGSRVIGLNGPAARRGEIGDFLMIISYAQVDMNSEALEPIVFDMRKLGE